MTIWQDLRSMKNVVQVYFVVQGIQVCKYVVILSYLEFLQRCTFFGTLSYPGQ